MDEETEKIEFRGYNIIVVLSTFLLSFTVFGYVNSWGVYQEYYVKNKYGNEFQISFVGSLSAGLEFGFSLIPATIISKFNKGFKIVLLLGIILCTISLLLSSFYNKLWQLYLIQGIIFGIGASFIFVSISIITPLWFSKSKALAIGIGASGSGIGGFVYSILTRKLINFIGIKWSLRTLSGIQFIVGLIIVMILKLPENTVLTRKHINLKPIKEKGFIIWILVVTLYAFTFMNPPNYISSYATFIGLTPDDGALFISIISISNAVGRILIGFISDKLGHINTGISCFFITTLSIFLIWTFSNSWTMLIIFSIIFGFFNGSYFTLATPISMNIAGLPNLPSSISLIYFATAIGTTFSPPICGILLDKYTYTYIPI